jgi:hypothetical protein
MRGLAFGEKPILGDCKGNRIRCLLNGKELIPPLTDNSFSAGKIGFWTKSDSIAYFVDTKLTYVPRESFPGPQKKSKT